MSSSASASASPACVSPPWTDLPSDLTANILQRLGAEEILQSAQFVCATWWKICLNPALWRVIKFVDRDYYSKKKLTTMCRRAVDLSRGQLIDLTLAYFGDDELLLYIVDRSSHLQRLTLACCSNITATTLIEALKNLHEVEALHLYLPSIYAGDVEAIGNICPMLKSFTLMNNKIEKSQGISLWLCKDNTQALAIAKTMPNLYHLGLHDNAMSNEGLQAILDGCPHLESLDLRLCYYVDLRGPLGERCRKQIKHVKLPSESMDDYEWVATDSHFNCSDSGSELDRWMEHLVIPSEDSIDDEFELLSSPHSSAWDFFNFQF